MALQPSPSKYEILDLHIYTGSTGYALIVAVPTAGQRPGKPLLHPARQHVPQTNVPVMQSKLPYCP